MKKARIMLTAIAMFAVVGGALAFKAHRGVLIVFKKNAAGTTCTRLPGLYRVNAAAPIATGIYTTQASSATSVPTSLCTSEVRIEFEP